MTLKIIKNNFASALENPHLCHCGGVVLGVVGQHVQRRLAAQVHGVSIDAGLGEQRPHRGQVAVLGLALY